jgi:hypothetical protein
MRILSAALECAARSVALLRGTARLDLGRSPVSHQRRFVESRDSQGRFLARESDALDVAEDLLHPVTFSSCLELMPTFNEAWIWGEMP